jgi:hypothetical protein
MLAHRCLGALHCVQHAVQLEGLGDIVERTALRRFHDRFNGPARGHQNHGALGILFAGRFQHVQPGALVDIDIGDDDGIGVFAQAFQCFAGGGYGIHRIAFQFQESLDGISNGIIVFDYKKSLHAQPYPIRLD